MKKVVGWQRGQWVLQFSASKSPADACWLSQLFLLSQLSPQWGIHCECFLEYSAGVFLVPECDLSHVPCLSANVFI